jgi:hypothetical protein
MMRNSHVRSREYPDAHKRSIDASSRVRWAARIIGLLCMCLLSAHVVHAGERYALVVTGASGGAEYAQKYDTWRSAFITTLRQTLHYPDDHVIVLAETASEGVRQATHENVRAAVTDLHARATKDDVVLVLLIGHGASADGDTAKFNLVGPDLSVDAWADLLRPFSARVVFVDTASGSFPYLEKLAGRNRIVITADDAAAQQFETVMPEFFVKAFDDNDADLDKNGKISVWEAFAYTSSRVHRWFEERGQLETERPLLDDSGDGVGREVDGTGPDGMAAQLTYLQPETPIPDNGDSELTALLRRRAALEVELDALRVRKPTMLPDEYEAALEKLLLEIAQIDRRVRTKS